MAPILPAAAEAADRWPSARLVVSATVAWALLAIELAVLAAYKVEIQSSFCGWAAWLRDTVALGDAANETLRHIHHMTDSFMYMQVCCLFLLATGKYTGTAAALYVYDVIAHMTKNFSKSFIASPRGFWFCTEGHAISCGSGYSLPSGHSMMSLTFSLFLLYRLPQHRHWLLPLVLAFETYTVFEVLYLGTHTPTDVVVGFTYAIAFFFAFRIWEAAPIRPLWRRLTAVPEVQLAAMLAATVAVYHLEALEDELDEVAHPLAWQENYTAYCQLAPGTAAARMRNSSAYIKTAMALGTAVAWYLRRRLALDEPDGGQAPWPARCLRAALGLLIFSNIKDLLRAALVPAVVPAWAPPVKYLPQVVQPLFLLVVAPGVARLVGLGNANANAAPKAKAA